MERAVGSGGGPGPHALSAPVSRRSNPLPRAQNSSRRCCTTQIRVRWSGLGTLASATSLSGPETWPRDCRPPSQIGLGALAELAGLCSSLSRSGPVRGRDSSPSRSGLGGGPEPPRVPGTISSGRRQNTRRGALVCHQVRAGEAEGGPGTPLAYSRRPEVPPLPAGAADWLKRGARPPSAPPPDRRRAEGRGRARRSRFR